MGYLLGTDEAGYGPNLGPLVISATLFQVPDVHSLKELARVDLYQRCRRYVTPVAPDSSTEPSDDSHPVWVADSKQLYKPGGGVHHLECGVLGSLPLQLASCHGENERQDDVGRQWPPRWTDLWHILAGQSVAKITQTPWYEDFDESLPIDASTAEVAQSTAMLTEAFAAADVRLVAIRSAVVFPEDFNRLLDVHGKKSDVLSKTTLMLVSQLIEDLPCREPVFVNCDKHGGRNRYGPLIQPQFPDTLVEVYGESRSLSVYRLGREQDRVELRFQAKGESFLPAALASMTSKYLRELAMRAFNDFWCHRIDNLKPTAGYPVDARRFHAQIRPAQRRLRIRDAVLWRRK